MASSSLSINCLYSAQALARPRTRNPAKPSDSRPKPSRKTLNPNSDHHKHAQLKSRRTPGPQPITLSGGEATTYTRLPPKQDFSVPSLSSSSFGFSAEVKLSDSDVAKFTSENKIDSLSTEDDEEEEEVDKEDGADCSFGMTPGRFDIFQGNAGSNDEDELEENYDSGYEDMVFEVDDGAVVYNYKNGDGDDDYGEVGYMDGEMVNLSDLEGDIQLKEKGVPAVMRCFDRAKIYVKAGDGGNGVMAFRREKYVPLGGPSGGDGGRGGNVYVEVDGSMNSLLPFRNSVHFRGARGAHGQGRMQTGARGEDVVVKVAPGTVIREAGKEEVLLELLYPGQRALLLPGGRGGKGNASFKSRTNKVPRIAENGEEGPEMWLELELKLVADVGIVGAPNAGKSTLLSVISAAQPAIANYSFTTLLPNLGVVSFDYDSTMVVADLPGLLEGAHRGFGLGHEFLRHTERCSALVHVVDGSAPQPELEFDAVRLELELFSPELAEKPYIVAYNKMDLPEAYKNWPLFKESLLVRGIESFCMSAVKRKGTYEVICAAYELLQKNKEASEEFEGWNDPVNLNHVADKVHKQRSASINEFEVFHDSSTNTWHVVGSGLQRFVQMTNWRYVDSEKRFQHVLEACGVNKSLKKLGVREGDTVIVGEMESIWHDSDENFGASNTKKGSADSIRWPQWK